MPAPDVEKNATPAAEASPSSRAAREKLNVFVSYARADTKFADQLVEGLEYDGGYEISIDRQSILEGEDWRARLGALIADCDTVVFLLSPTSAASHVCNWEVEEAVRRSKRILPVVVQPVGNGTVPPVLSALNYVRFDDGRSFINGLKSLRRALNTDLKWIREHSRLMERATEWHSAGRTDNRLLTGADIAAAKAWLDSKPSDAPEATELHRDFIKASDLAETARQSIERQRAETLQRAVTRTRLALAGALALAVAAGAAGWWARLQGVEANNQRAIAEAKSAKTEELIGLLLENLKVSWPDDDTKSPDYRHLASLPLARSLKGAEFDVTSDSLNLLLRANAFNPIAMGDKIVFALRGAEIVQENTGTWSPVVRLRDVRPDHVAFRCVFVVLDKSTGKLAAFPGSTVPARRAIPEAFKAIHVDSGFRANLLTTGMYQYVGGTQRSARPIPGILRQGMIPDRIPLVAVRRSYNDLSYDVTDTWDIARVSDNLTPSQSDKQFFSVGTLVIRGVFVDEKHTLDYAAFRSALGFSQNDYNADNGKRVDITLVTGLDAAVAAALIAKNETPSGEGRAASLDRIRFGSRGQSVAKLRRALGLSASDEFDTETVGKLAELQKAKLKWSDGIYSPEMDKLLGLCVFSTGTC